MRSESGCREEVVPEKENADIVRRTGGLKEEALRQTAQTMRGGSGCCEEVQEGEDAVIVDLALGLAVDWRMASRSGGVAVSWRIAKRCPMCWGYCKRIVPYQNRKGNHFVVAAPPTRSLPFKWSPYWWTYPPSQCQDPKT